MGAIKAVWGAATTRAIAVVSVILLCVVYIVRSWRRAGIDRSIHKERVKVMREFDKQRAELDDNRTEEIAAHELELKSKLAVIDTKEATIKADADHSRKRLADALNNSFGR